ncbi:hypothetical protein CEXT_294541 [Caerostris extrusa]|uniref:Uncharacterized protein n=1 Tax=Caerostris extrusa TaxID=172846 RepID=A0AAV4R3F6_CAEEX|nr:hypothetical protein CEXT_294541 [Caerostris extrusa]
MFCSSFLDEISIEHESIKVMLLVLSFSQPSMMQFPNSKRSKCYYFVHIQKLYKQKRKYHLGRLIMACSIVPMSVSDTVEYIKFPVDTLELLFSPQDGGSRDGSEDHGVPHFEKLLP